MKVVIKSVKRYQFEGHKHDYEYLYSVVNYRMFCICNEENCSDELSDRYILTKNGIQIMSNESQITLECLLVEELMNIDIKSDTIEFVDVALAIIDKLSKKEEVL